MMTFFIRLLASGALTALFALLIWAPIAQAATVVTTEQVKAELLVNAPEGLRPGVKAWLGLKIVHKRGWHTYWLNPGDSGLPTQLQWQLPANFQVGEIEWPVPHRLPVGPLMNHGYEGTLLLPVPLMVTQALPDAPVKIQLRADWLVCEAVCIPEGGDFSLTLPAGAGRSALVKDAALFELTRAKQPVAWPGSKALASVDDQGLKLELSGLPAAWQGRKLSVFPMAAQVLSPSVEPQSQWGAAGVWSGRMAHSPQRMETPLQMSFVVALEQTAGGGGHGDASAKAETSPAGIVLTTTVAGAWPALDAGVGTTTDVASVSAAGAANGPSAGSTIGSSGTTREASGAGQGSWWGAALFAVLGGLILNLMPCVFPVLSLKVFGFAADAHNRRALALGGIAYTVGVVLSFTALAAVLLALRASGEQLGWGFQLQSPPFVAALALLFTLMGLNLLGQFEFNMMVPGSWAAARVHNPVVDHFLTGVLAVTVASPCTAPFMGASLGVAMTLPTAQAIGIFAALGVGMAAPYLLFSLMPTWAARLPRPGAWMLKVKQAMALPMLATVVWLLWVLGNQAGVDAASALLGLLLVLAFAIGAWRWASGLSGSGRLVARTTVIGAMAAGASWTWPLLQHEAVGSNGNVGSQLASAARGVPAMDTQSSAGASADWIPWSPKALADELAQGRIVFVDYTAAWCVTCQVNKRSTLRQDEVVQALRVRSIVTMQADWTKRDEAITRELTRLGRTGVPVYVFYRQGLDPVLLPEVLTPALVMKAIEQLPR